MAQTLNRSVNILVALDGEAHSALSALAQRDNFSRKPLIETHNRANP